MILLAIGIGQLELWTKPFRFQTEEEESILLDAAGGEEVYFFQKGHACTED